MGVFLLVLVCIVFHGYFPCRVECGKLEYNLDLDCA
jgi:hypothetical protein